MHPSLRSKLKSILLLAVAETSMISKYGISSILEPFVEEMKQLESVNFNIYFRYCLFFYFYF